MLSKALESSDIKKLGQKPAEIRVIFTIFLFVTSEQI